jgi:iron complex outermembrane receptor protein
MRTVRATVCTLVALALCSAASAQTARVSLDIKEQPMRSALKELGDRTGLQILYRVEDVAKEGVLAPKVAGELSAEEALDRLLAGSGLTYEFVNEKTVRIVSPGAGDAMNGPAGGGAGPELAEVVVTGSSIASSVDAEKRSIPVDVISAEQIGKTGANTLADVLAANPALTNGALAEQDSGGRGFANLRGLGTQYTLVLLNGRRLSANDPTNILAIPAEAVERIEILKSGASAVYGSDAVAGVINVILKSSAQGLHASLTYGDTTQGGAQTTDVSLYGGSETDRARYFFLINHMTRSEIRARDRHITSTSDKRVFGGFDERDQFGSPGRIGGITGSPDLIADAGRIPAGSYSLDPADYRPYDPDADLFDTNAVVDPSIISAPERLTMVGSFEQDFRDGRLTFFTTGLFWQMREKLYTAPNGLSFSDPALGPVPASNPYNPFGQDVTDLDYLPLELGRRLKETPAHTYRLNGGLRGEIGSWQLESAVSWYRSGFTNRYHHSINKAALQAAVNRTGADAFNPFCNQCNTTEQFAGLLTTSSIDIAFRSDMVDFRASGPLWRLPTGELLAAVGAEYRREGVFLEPDPLWQSGGAVGFFGFGGYDFHRTIRSGFAEVRVPLLTPADGTSESPLELSLAARFEKYSDFGSETSPLATLRYAFLGGQATLRASYSKGFLAPYLEYAAEDYGGTYTDFLIDPLTGTAVETLVIYSGSPDIEPERSTTRNIGLILTPDAVPGLTVTLDAYEIEQTDFTAFDAQAAFEGNAPGEVTRGVDIGPGGEDAILRTRWFNVNERSSAGYELTTNYRLPELAAGRFEVDAGIARLEKFEVFGLVPGQLVDLAGGYDPTAGTFFGTPTLPKTRAVLGLSWERGPWSATTQLNYQSSFRETDDSTIPSYSTTDLQVGYELGGEQGGGAGWLNVRGAQLTLGVENVFDREVPFLTVINDFNRYENDLRGRFIYARVGLDF